MSRVPCEHTGSSCSALGLTPASLPVLLPTLDLTQHHSSPLQGAALASLNRRHAPTLLSEQPNSSQPIMTIISQNRQFVVWLDRVGFA